MTAKVDKTMPCFFVKENIRPFDAKRPAPQTDESEIPVEDTPAGEVPNPADMNPDELRALAAAHGLNLPPDADLEHIDRGDALKGEGLSANIAMIEIFGPDGFREFCVNLLKNVPKNDAPVTKAEINDAFIASLAHTLAIDTRRPDLMARALDVVMSAAHEGRQLGERALAYYIKLALSNLAADFQDILNRINTKPQKSAPADPADKEEPAEEG